MKHFVQNCLMTTTLMASVAVSASADDVVIQPIAPQRPPKPAAANPGHQAIMCKRLWTDGKIVQVELTVPTGRQVSQTYQVQVPFVEDGVNKIRQELRTRLVPETETKRVDASEVFLFYDLDGKQLDPAELVKRIPQKGLVGVLSRTPGAPAIWKEVLKPDTVVIGQRPPKP